MRKAMFGKQLTASFTPETYDRIKEITDARGISMGEWLREAAEAMLENDDHDIQEGGNNK